MTKKSEQRPCWVYLLPAEAYRLKTHTAHIALKVQGTVGMAECNEQIREGKYWSEGTAQQVAAAGLRLCKNCVRVRESVSHRWEQAGLESKEPVSEEEESYRQELEE